MPSPYATVGESHEELWFEQSNYIATHIASMCYGAQITVFLIATYHVLRWHASAKRRLFWLFFLFLLTATATINLACSIKFNQSAWIDERSYPGGPFEFLVQQQSRPILTLGNTAWILGSFLADGILLYRVMVLWNFIWYIIIPPTLFYIACIILSILTVIQIADPTFTNIVNLSFTVWLVLMIINIALSAMIAIRIMILRRDIQSGLGTEYAKAYVTIASIVVEAALPFTILSIVLLVLFGGKNTAQNLFVPLLVEVECLSPSLIILRVIVHANPEKNRTNEASNIQFAPRLPAGTESTFTNISEKQGKKDDNLSSELKSVDDSLPTQT